MKSISASIIEELNLDLEYYNRIINRNKNDIIHINVPKKNGKYRVVKQIKYFYKPLQYWLLYKFLNLFPVSEYATAYEKNSSIYKNAEKHAENDYFLKIDLKDFFPSITYKDFITFLNKNNKYYEKTFLLSKKDEIILKNCLFDENNRLPQGFCTSPKIINILMYDFDNSLIELLKKYTEFNAKYSRYSDDIIISCNKKGLSYRIFKEIDSFINNWKNPNIKINNKKTTFGSIKRGNVLVTGLKIKNNNKVDITKKKKDEIRLLLSLFKKGKFKIEDMNKLKGNLEFAKVNAPGFYTIINTKYFLEICSLYEYYK